jgi:hypothetical protein
VEHPVVTRWTFGPQLGYTLSTSAIGTATLGGFASYRLFNYCDLDASMSAFLQDPLLATQEEGGGRVLQGVAGVKLGVREGRFGVFFKARGGVNSYARTLFINPALQTSYRRSTVPALDIGGVVEMYLRSGLVLRIDVGETLSFVRFDVIDEVVPPAIETFRQEIYSLPIRLGLGWRF